MATLPATAAADRCNEAPLPGHTVLMVSAGGNRQQAALAAALARGPGCRLLDEPTAGPQPLPEATFGECASDGRREGRTILPSCHLLAEAEALAARVTIIHEAKPVETGTDGPVGAVSRTGPGLAECCAAGRWPDASRPGECAGP